MKNIYITALVIAGLISIPQFSFAAFNDATLTTDAVISVGGYTLNISGSSAVVESIVVNSSSFSVTLGSGSSFSVTSASLNELNTDVTTGVTKVCTSSASSLALASAATVTITPSATICSGSGTPAPAVTSSGSVSGGSGYVSSIPFTTPVSPTSPNTPSPVTSKTFARSLTVGASGSDVKALQVFLNTRGYTVAKTGPGSPGNETTLFGALTRAALIKFQKANKITPAVGFFGPITRTYVK